MVVINQLGFIGWEDECIGRWLGPGPIAFPNTLKVPPLVREGMVELRRNKQRTDPHDYITVLDLDNIPRVDGKRPKSLEHFIRGISELGRINAHVTYSYKLRKGACGIALVLEIRWPELHKLATAHGMHAILPYAVIGMSKGTAQTDFDYACESIAIENRVAAEWIAAMEQSQRPQIGHNLTVCQQRAMIEAAQHAACALRMKDGYTEAVFNPGAEPHPEHLAVPPKRQPQKPVTRSKQHYEMSYYEVWHKTMHDAAIIYMKFTYFPTGHKYNGKKPINRHRESPQMPCYIAGISESHPSIKPVCTLVLMAITIIFLA